MSSGLTVTAIRDATPVPHNGCRARKRRRENVHAAGKIRQTRKPRKIVVDEKTISQTFARFIAEPFERVLGHNVHHEFMAVEGIAEDVTNIVLNVKDILLRALPSEESSVIREASFVTSELDVSQEDLDKAGGQVLVTACQVFASSPITFR
ncbi:hypothetical protein ACTFIW_003729 [Dictyostelium discoideum]